jgi:hypothetical protein
VRGVIELRRDLEAAAAIGIKESCEHRGESKYGRQRKSIDPSHAHQRDRMEIADDPVALEGRVAVCHETPSSIKDERRANHL